MIFSVSSHVCLFTIIASLRFFLKVAKYGELWLEFQEAELRRAAGKAKRPKGTPLISGDERSKEKFRRFTDTPSSSEALRTSDLYEATQKEDRRSGTSGTHLVQHMLSQAT